MGFQGAEPLSGQSLLKLMLLGGGAKIAIEALTEYVFLCTT